MIFLENFRCLFSLKDEYDSVPRILKTCINSRLVPRPRYSAQVIRFGSRGPSRDVTEVN